MNPRAFAYIAGLVLIVGVLTHEVTLVSVGLLAELLLGVAWAWQRLCLEQVTYSRRFSEDHVFWGETVELTIALANRKLLPLAWVETDEELSDKLEFVDYEPDAVSGVGQVGLGHATALRWFERVVWRYQ